MDRGALLTLLVLALTAGASCGGDVQPRQPISPVAYSLDLGGAPDAGAPAEPDLHTYQADPDAAVPASDVGPAPDTAPASPCDYDETFFDGACYSAPGLKWMTYETGEQICATRNAQVASITSQAMNDMIFGLLAPLCSQAWVALHKENGVFQWTDGQPLGFVNWAPGEPNNENGVEDCAVMWGPGLRSYPEWQGQWNDTACDTDVDTVICRRTP